LIADDHTAPRSSTMTTFPDSARAQMITKVELPINVTDLAVARRWYADYLGITFDDRNRAEVAGVTLVLFEFDDLTPCSHVVVQLVTDDLAGTHQRLSQLDPTTPDVDAANQNLVVTDPSHTKIVLYQPR
jgi:hypothetical protein